MAQAKVAQRNGGTLSRGMTVEQRKAAQIFVALAASEGRKLTPRQAFDEINEADAKARYAEAIKKTRLLASNTKRHARESIDEALQTLAVVRDMAQAMQDGEEFAKYIPEQDLARLMRLSIVDAGSAMERALADLGVVEVNSHTARFLDIHETARQ